MNKTLIFFKIVLLAVNTLISVNFALVEAFPKFIFWYSIKLHPWEKFSVSRKESCKARYSEYGEWCTGTILYFAKKQFCCVLRVLRLHNPVFQQKQVLVSIESVILVQSCALPNTSSGEYRGCCTCTILCCNKNKFGWVLRVWYLYNPVLCQILVLVSIECVALAQSCVSTKTSSGEYWECGTCTILCFAKY